MRLAAAPLLRAIALLGAFALLGAGCGVGFGSADEGNEFFKSAKVTGERRVGSMLTGTVTYESNYPIEIQITCEVRRGKELVQALGSVVSPALPDGTPKSTPVPGSHSYDFTLNAPGVYKFQCYTPKDEDNYITREFTVAPAPAVTVSAGN